LSAACSDTLERRAVGSRAGAAAINQGMNFNAQKSQQELNPGNRYVAEDQREVTFANVQQMNDRAFFQRDGRWIDGRIVGESKKREAAGLAGGRGLSGAGASGPGAPSPRAATETENASIEPDVIVEYGSDEYLALVSRLTAQNRQGILALDGEILLEDDGKVILVRNSTD
jgi:hypothetical protein